MKKKSETIIEVEEVIQMFKQHDPENYYVIINRIKYFVGKEKMFLKRMLIGAISASVGGYDILNKERSEIENILLNQTISDQEKIKLICLAIHFRLI